MLGKPKVILGIDPGTHRMGFAILKSLPRFRFEILEYGTKEIPSGTGVAESLLFIRKEVVHLVSIFQPNLASVEELFFNKNLKTAAKVYQARGVILLTLAESGIPLVEPTATQIKKGVTGSGRADKKQIRSALQLILGLKDLKGHDDSWDAVAAAFVGYGMC
jgi:crossover junction endodeoxyribonuclease RuvC